MVRDGQEYERWRVVDPTTVEITVEIGVHDLVVVCDHDSDLPRGGAAPPATTRDQRVTTTTGICGDTAGGTAGAAIATPSPAAIAAIAAVSSCRRC